MPALFSLSAQIMRGILVDAARGHQADKRGGSEIRVTLDETGALRRDDDLVRLDPRWPKSTGGRRRSLSYELSLIAWQVVSTAECDDSLHRVTGQQGERSGHSISVNQNRSSFLKS
jgi:hypothetical protein